MVPVMPGTRIEKAGRRILQCLLKSIPPVVVEGDTDVIPCCQCHDPAEKQRRIFKGGGNRLPPANAAGYSSQMRIAGLFGLHTFGRDFQSR